MRIPVVKAPPFLLFALSLCVQSLFSLPAQATQDIPAASFTSAPCMFSVPAGYTEGKDVDCGYLTVPEKHADPSGPKIRLAVVIIRSLAIKPEPDPLVMAQGGPGGSTIDTYAERLLSNDRYRQDRDIVLFDQRGTLYSEPHLDCTEIYDLIADTIEKDLPNSEADRLNLAALQGCRERLAKSGINLAAFNSLENAADIAALQEALGYAQINLYGVSYGTLLALHTLRLYPNNLRSVILDAVVPPQTNFLLAVPQTMDRAFTLLFSACLADPACDKAYPDLEQVFLETYNRLEQEPARWPMTDMETGTTYPNAVIDGETFLYGIFQMLYASSLIPALPRAIYAARDGNFDFFARILSILVFDRSVANGMYYSVICAEDADFNPDDQSLAGVRPIIAQAEEGDAAQTLQICQDWNVPYLGPALDEPVTSDIPTLILSGEFDPVTPPAYAAQVAETLPNSHLVVFPAGSHGVAFEGACEDQIILEFLHQPGQPPDTACLRQKKSIDFFTPATVIDFPLALKLLNLDGGAVLTFLLLFASLLFLLGAWIIFPITWLWRSARKPAPVSPPDLPSQVQSSAENIPAFPNRGQASPWWMKLAAPVALLNGAVISLFLGNLGYVIVTMLSENDNRLFFGVRAEARPWFILPLVSMILTAWMISAGLRGWRSRGLSLWRRIYYAMLSLAALGCLVILTLWGATFAVF